MTQNPTLSEREALKPCPFCGADAYLDYDTDTGMFGAESEHERGCLLMNWDFRFYADENDAIAAWNRRAPVAPAEPVAWRVKDCLDGWIYYDDKARAEHEAAIIHAKVVEPLYGPSAQPSPVTGALVEHEAFAIVERRLRSLISGEFSSLTLSFNDMNGPNYESVRKTLEGGFETDLVDFVSEVEASRAAEMNSHWRLQWYPRTPVGFNNLDASSLEAIADALAAQKAEG